MPTQNQQIQIPTRVKMQSRIKTKSRAKSKVLPKIQTNLLMRKRNPRKKVRKTKINIHHFLAVQAGSTMWLLDF